MELLLIPTYSAMPAPSLNSPRAPWPPGRRSKAASGGNRGRWGARSAGAMGIWLARRVQHCAGRRASAPIVGARPRHEGALGLNAGRIMDGSRAGLRPGA